MSVGSLNTYAEKGNYSNEPNKTEAAASEPILTFEIDIGDGKKIDLLVNEGDDPHKLAIEFCNNNQIPQEHVLTIEQSIIANIKQANIKSEENIDDEEVEESSKNIIAVHNELSEKKMHINYLGESDTKIDKIDMHRTEERTLFKRRVHSIDCTSNIGEKLYHKGRIMREEIEKQIRYQQQRREESELEAVTLYPKINKYIGKRDGRLEDNLISYKYAIENKNLKEKERIILEEREGCTFKPDINRESEKMANQRKKQISAEMCNRSCVNEYEYLYEDSKRRIENMNKVISASKERECTFRPNREQTKYFQYSSVKKKKSKKPSHVSIDETTGREWFKPKTGRAPKVARNNEKLPIGNYLYKQRQNKVNNADKLIKELEQQNCKLVVNDSSDCIYEKAKSDAFEYIFKCLDSDSDGKISQTKIFTKGIALIRYCSGGVKNTRISIHRN